MKDKFKGISNLLNDEPTERNDISEKKTLQLVTAPIRMNAGEKRITTSYSIKGSLVKRVKLISAEYDMKNWQVVEAALTMYFESLEKKSE